MTIANHAIRSTHRPKIEFSIAGADLPALALDLALSLDLEAAIVAVANGAVSEVVPGVASANASLAAAGKTVAEGRIARVAFPPTLRQPAD